MAHCSVTNSAECAPLMPIIPRPPPRETARASSPPDTPAIGAPMIGVERSNQRVSGVLITRPSCRRRGSLGSRAPVLGALETAQALMTALGALRVLVHDFAEEARDVVEVRVLGVPHVLAVVVPGLQRVVLHRDQVVGDVGEAGLTSCHRVLLDQEWFGQPP